MPTYASTADFNLSISEIIEEAFERCGIQDRSGYELKTARRSLNLLLAEWSNRGLNLWTIQKQTAALTANTTTELLTQPLIVEGGKTFTIQSSSSDSFDVAISYLNIKKEVTT